MLKTYIRSQSLNKLAEADDARVRMPVDCMIMTLAKMCIYLKLLFNHTIWTITEINSGKTFVSTILCGINEAFENACNANF